jgi:AcrR family transcriptional regulator
MARRRARRPGQPGGVRDLNRKAKQQALLDAALLLFLERGIEGVSVDDITQKSKMAKGSFYRYFDTQEALVAELLEPTRAQMTEALEHCARELSTASTRELQFLAYRRVGDMVSTLLLTHPGVVRLYLQECRAPAVGARKPVVELSRVISKFAIDITRKAQAHGILRPIPVAVSALAVVGASERLLLGVLLEEPLGNPLDIPEALTSLILDGLKA